MEHITIRKMIKKTFVLLSISFLILACSSAIRDHTIIVPMRDGIQLSTWISSLRKNRNNTPLSWYAPKTGATETSE